MFTDDTGELERRNVLKALGVSGMVGLAGCTGQQQNQQAVDDASGTAETAGSEQYHERIPVIDAYYEGNKVWFIHTGVTSKQMAKRLTTMVSYPTQYVPKNAEVVDHAELANIYVFKNGVNRSDAEPWGGGPFHYQIDIMDAVPGDESYTSLRNPHIVMWSDKAEPRILKSETALLDAEEAGELTIKQTNVVVTAPVMRWPGQK